MLLVRKLSPTARRLQLLMFALAFCVWLRWRRYNARAFALYRSLLDSATNDVAIDKSFEYMKGCASALSEKHQHRFPASVDVVCGGGGFKCCYAGGVILILQQCGVKLERFAGASAGSQIAFLGMTNQMRQGLRWAMAVAETFQRFPRVYPEPLWSFFYKRCARDAEFPLPGQFGVSITEITKYLPPAGINQVVSTFVDKEDVGEALMATGAVPFLTSAHPFGRLFQGMRVMDGGITDNCPAFTDGKLDQLIITNDFLEARWQGRMCGLYFSAAEMLELMRLGVDDGARLLRGEAVPGLELRSAAAGARTGRQASDVSLATVLHGIKQAYTMKGA